jgi:hypothetical protein
VKVGNSSGQADVAVRGAELLTIASLIYHAVHASMNKTVNATSSHGHACYNHHTSGDQSLYGCSFRAWSGTFYVGLLTTEQIDAIYMQGVDHLQQWSVHVPCRALMWHPNVRPRQVLVHDMWSNVSCSTSSPTVHTSTLAAPLPHPSR